MFFNNLILPTVLILAHTSLRMNPVYPVSMIRKALRIIPVLVLLYSGLYAQNYQLHSVFMYSFARYIQWPADAGATDFSIEVLGDSPILAELNTLASKKKVGEKAIRVTKVSSVNELKKCNILFIPADKSALLPEVLTKFEDSSMLIVTEQSGLGTKGSNINFLIKEGKLVFELNVNSLTRKKLKPSTELTRLAILI
jgi:YfiR/HmsC-like